MKVKKYFIKSARFLPQVLLLISVLTSNVFFPAIAIAQELPSVDNTPQEEVVDIPIDTSEDILEEGVSTSIFEEEEADEPLFVFEDGIYTVSTVVEGEEYVYPDNGDVRITFNEVTEDGNLVIKRVELSDEDREELNTTDEYAWDISSTMSNGSFRYDLTLPNTQGNDVEVKYTEDGNTYESVNTVSLESNVVILRGLDHFTTFVVVNPLPSGISNGDSCTVASINGTCYDTIQAAINAAEANGDAEQDIINIQNGTYNEHLTITGNNITLLGESRTGVIIDTSGFTTYGIHALNVDNVKFRKMTVIGAQNYTFKISHSSNITLRQITVKNSQSTGIDLNTIDGANINSVTVKDTSNGFGLMILDSNDIAVNTINTSGNAWGGVSVQTSSRVSDNITFSGNFNAQESAPFLLENDPPYYDITNITAPSKFNYIVYTLREGSNYRQWFYREDLEDAKLFAESLVTSTTFTYSDIVIYNIAEDNYWVIPEILIQDAIDHSTDGDTINIFSGIYTENANYNPSDNTNSGNNPVGLLVNKGITLQGINSLGNEIMNTANIEATIISEIQSNWGTNFFITAPNVTIRGLELLGNESPGQAYVNKAIEVINNNFTIEHCIVDGTDSLDVYGSVYINDYNVPSNTNPETFVSSISTFRVANNILRGSLSVTNGPGTGINPENLDMVVTGNLFENSPTSSINNSGIYITGYDDEVAWRNAPVVIPEIYGNVFSNDIGGILLARDDDATKLLTLGDVEDFINNNTLPKGVYITTPTDELFIENINTGYGYTNAVQIYLNIQEAVDNSSSGNTINTIPGTYQENVTIDKPLSLIGEDRETTIISPTSGDVIEINAHSGPNLLVDGLTIQGFTLRTNDASIALQSNSSVNDGFDGANYLYKDLIVDENGYAQSAIGLFDVDTVTLDNVIVKNSTRVGAGAIEIIGVKDFTMINSKVINNTEGLKVWSYSGYEENSNFEIHNSTFDNNTSYGILNNDTNLIVNATNNWWGDITGPSGESFGKGDSVSTDVTFCPWLKSENGDPVETCSATNPIVNINSPSDGNFVNGNLEIEVEATDNWGMGSYYIRLWQNAPYVSNGGILVNQCYSAPGGTNLGTSRTDTCAFDTTVLNDGETYYITAQYLNTLTKWGSDDISVNIDNSYPTILESTMYVERNGTWQENYLTKSGDNVKVEVVVEDDYVDVDSVQIWIREYPWNPNNNELISGNMTMIDSTHFEFIYTVPDTYKDGDSINEAVEGNYFNFRPFDSLGNSHIGWRDNFTIDNTAPSAPTGITIKDSQGNDLGCGAYTNNKSITIDWNDNPEDDIAYYKYDIKDKNNHSQPTESEFSGDIRDQDGYYQYRVWAVDEAGNISEESSDWCGITLDREAPEQPTGLERRNLDGEIFACGDTAQRETMIPDWDDITDDPSFSHFEYSSFHPDGAQGKDEMILHESEFINNWTAQEDGTYGYAVRSVDKAGNKSDWSLTGESLADSCQITYDSVAPEVYLTSPIDNYYTNSTSVLQTWDTTATDVDHYEYRSCWNDPTSEACDDPIWEEKNITTKSRTVNNNNITFWWQVRAVDNVGNEGQWSEAWKMTIDGIAPLVDITSHEDGDIVNNNITIEGVASDINLSHYWFVIQNSVLGNTVAGLNTVPTTSSPSFINYTWNTNSLPDGEYIVKLEARDLAGNKDPNQAPVSIDPEIDTDSIDWVQFTVDNTPPTGTIDSVQMIDNHGVTHHITEWVINDNTPLIEGIINDENGVKSFKVSIDGIESDYGSGSSIDYAAGFSNPFADGSHTITLEIEDFAGNSTTITQSLFIDTIAPTATYKHYKDNVEIDEIDNPITYVHGINQLTFTAEYTDTEPSSGLLQDSYVIFEAQDDGSFRFSQNGKKAFCSWRKEPNLVTGLSGSTDSLATQEEFINCVDSLPEGEYYMAHQVYDSAVRKDIPTIYQFRDVLGLHFIVDTTPPTIEGHADITLLEGDAFPTDTVSLTDNYELDRVYAQATDLTGTMGSSGYMDVEIDASNLSGDQFSLADEIRQAIEDWQGSAFTIIDLDVLPEGQYEIAYYTTDKSGNQSNIETFIVTIENNPPTVEILATTTEITQGDADIELVAGVTTGNAPFTYLWSGDCSGTAQTTIFPGDSEPGQYTCTVTVTDSDGDTSQESIDITVGEVLGEETEEEGETQGATTQRIIYASNTTENNGTGSGEEITQLLDDNGEVAGETCENPRKVSGYVYLDRNKNEERNENEKGIQGVTITIYYTNEEGNKITMDIVDTDENGYWETELCEGTYAIEIDQETLPKNTKTENTLSLTVSDEDVIFNIQALDTRTFWQKYWYLILLGAALLLTVVYLILSRQKKEQQIQ